ncbi:anthocyanidin 3-O-glucosyltransferase 4-like [Musa acuminata AAA Group]|uniref:anthocyanidin 3-O-glucosyltransferase 4-like n=1 Tax=Musa acuminata AAA Group TaxID=214697 RepID=UPI0031E0451C
MVRGWGPQRPILNHRAVGAFITHCGWNSVVEAVSAGVPMITWPMFAEQFYNEKLVVQVLRVGVSVGPGVWGMEQEKKPVVGGAAIAAAVAQLMDGRGEAEEGMRKRAAALKQKARDSVGVGGSSYLEMDRLIHELSVSEGDAVDSRTGSRCG